MSRQVNNAPLKPGFIFIREEEHWEDLPEAYQAVRNGGTGFFAKLTASDPNGFEAIAFDEYQRIDYADDVTYTFTASQELNDLQILHLNKALETLPGTGPDFDDVPEWTSELTKAV